MLKGEINPNLDRVEELFAEIVRSLVDKQARIAIWLLKEFDLSQFEYQAIGRESPFTDSNSKLFDPGFLISIQPAYASELITTLSDRLTYEICHFEIEVEGKVQFKSYDHCLYNFFGDEISLDLLADLQARGVIESYHLYAQEP